MTDNPNHVQLVNALRRECIRIATEEAPDSSYRMLHLLRAERGRLRLGSLPISADVFRESGDMTIAMQRISSVFSTPRGQVMLHTCLDEAFCGVAVVAASVTGDWSAAQTMGAKLAGWLLAFGASLLDDDEAFVIYEYATGVAMELDVNEAPPSARDVMSGVWSVLTAIDDSIAAPLPNGANQIALQVFIDGGGLDPFPASAQQSLGTRLMAGGVTEILPVGRSVPDTIERLI